jgi:hypothetical protein
LKVADVPGCNSGALRSGNGGDLSVHDADGAAELSSAREDIGEDTRRSLIEAQNTTREIFLERVLSSLSSAFLRFPGGVLSTP